MDYNLSEAGMLNLSLREKESMDFWLFKLQMDMSRCSDFNLLSIGTVVS